MFAAIDGVRNQQQASRLVEADLIAVTNDDGVTSVKVTDPDTKNLVWAKLYGSDARPVQAYNTRVQPRAKAPVWLRQLADGTYEVEGMRSRDGTDFYGEAAGTMNTPEQIGELLGTVWPARNLKPGRARLTDTGGMTLYIESFYHSQGYFIGGYIDLTDYVPATTSKQVWAVIWYDPVSDVLGVTTSDEYDLPHTMIESELGDVHISPQYIPLAGVILREGDTVIDGSSVIIARQNWIDAPMTSEMLWPIEISDARFVPANRQIAVRRQGVIGDGVLTVYGVLDVF